MSEPSAARNTGSTRLPITDRPAASRFALVTGHPIRVDEFAADVLRCADALPPTSALVNLHADRYAFTVTFFAACTRGVTNLLPAQRDPASIDALIERTGAQVVGTEGDKPLFQAGANGRVDPSDARLTVAPDHIAAVVTTSGSTGQPNEHTKPWALLDSFRRLHASVLEQACDPEARPDLLIATVPSWHMYGLEWALLLPTVTPLTLYCGPDFYPQDVQRALASAERGSVLVSTPVHLKALMRSTEPSNQTAVTLSATAPIDTDFAQRVERHLGGTLFEIYGCSEVGSLAQRFTANEIAWHFFEPFQISDQDGTLSIDHALLNEPVELADDFEPAADGYTLIGRSTDTVKVSGKRDSLTRLNMELQALPGVLDGVFYDPEQLSLPDTGRLGALVVTDGLTPSEVKSLLATKLDSAFVPRPIRQVEALPRSPSGKLQRDALQTLLRELTDDAEQS